MSGKNMENEITTADAGADQNPSGNMSDLDFVNIRLGRTQVEEEPKEEVEEVEQPEVEEVAEQSEEIAEEVVTEEAEVGETDDVLSKLDLDNMTDDELKELSEKLGSRAVARFGEMTARRKAAEEKAALLEARLAEKPDPLSQEAEVKNNPFNSLDTVEKLQEKSKEVGDIVEWAEDVLFQSDSYAADDVVTEIEGKEMTKAEVRQHLLQARKAQKTFLPAQLKKVQVVESAKQAETAFTSQAEKELPWMIGDDNDLRRNYESAINDDRFKKLKSVVLREVPEVSGQINYLIAHATNSIYGRKPVAEKKSSLKLNPPTSGVPSVAKSEKSESKKAKTIKELSNKFNSSHSTSDFIKLRTLSHLK
jgi:hypothetical protein